ncbi:MAG: fasciclin domain-containing protein [Flavobacteriales bacterium]|nr:fasciclin domain-containing protein [Flavobacteriales bacterium]
MTTRHPFKLTLTLLAFTALSACGGGSEQPASTATTPEANAPDGGQSTVVDDQSQKNVVGIAVGSADHTTLVAAVKAAELVDALSNAGPFTVFAPTNAAFNALPAGTVDGLLKPEKKADLQSVLQYHVFVGVLKAENLRDGQMIGMVDGGNAKIIVKDGKVMINDANVVASVPASNGIVHVIDKVIFPLK